MGNMMQANELEPGDLYREFRPHSAAFGPGGAHVLMVTGRRTVRYAETYQVLETTSIDGRNLRGEISLRTDQTVERLDRVDLREVTELLKVAQPGETVAATYYDGWFWL